MAPKTEVLFFNSIILLHTHVHTHTHNSFNILHYFPLRHRKEIYFNLAYQINKAIVQDYWLLVNYLVSMLKTFFRFVLTRQEGKKKV